MHGNEQRAAMTDDELFEILAYQDTTLREVADSDERRSDIDILFTELSNRYNRPDSTIADLLRAKFIIAEITFLDRLDARLPDQKSLKAANDIKDLAGVLNQLTLSELDDLVDFVCDEKQRISTTSQLYICKLIAKEIQAKRKYTTDPNCFNVLDNMLYALIERFKQNLAKSAPPDPKELLDLLKPWRNHMHRKQKDTKDLMYALEEMLFLIGKPELKDDMYNALNLTRPNFDVDAEFVCLSDHLIGASIEEYAGNKIRFVANQHIGAGLTYDQAMAEFDFSSGNNLICICASTNEDDPADTQYEVYRFKNKDEVTEFCALYADSPDEFTFHPVQAIFTEQVTTADDDEITLASFGPFDQLRGSLLQEYTALKQQLIYAKPAEEPRPALVAQFEAAREQNGFGWSEIATSAAVAGIAMGMAMYGLRL